MQTGNRFRATPAQEQILLQWIADTSGSSEKALPGSGISLPDSPERSLIVFEDLKVKNMAKRPALKKDEARQHVTNGATAKAGLNWAILSSISMPGVCSAARRWTGRPPYYSRAFFLRSRKWL